MAFPKKHTRTILIDDVEYVWHLNSNWETKNSWIVIARKEYESYQLLFLDPYHHDILPTQRMAASAIRFGLKHGWNPLMKGQPIRLAYNGQSFEKLPEDMQNWEHHNDMKYLQPHKKARRNMHQ